MNTSLASFPATAQKLILATEELVAERGVEGASVREILRRSGQKNNSAIYLYFESRERLIDTAFHIRQREVDDARRAALDELGGMPDDRISLLGLLLLPTLRAFDRRGRILFAKFVLHLILHDPRSYIFANERQPVTTNRIMAALRASCAELSDEMFHFRVVMSATHFLQAIIYCEETGFSGEPPTGAAFWDEVVLSLDAALGSPAHFRRDAPSANEDIRHAPTTG